MFEIKFKGKIERNERQIKQILSDFMERVVFLEGCTNCHGKNLTVYVNEIGKNMVDGYFYCHDCKRKGDVHMTHDLYGELDKIENKFKEMIKKLS